MCKCRSFEKKRQFAPFLRQFTLRRVSCACVEFTKTALERRRIGDLKSSGGDYAAACFNAIDAYTGFHPLLRNPIMSDISNRSAYRVTAARRPEHDRVPRHNIARLA